MPATGGRVTPRDSSSAESAGRPSYGSLHAAPSTSCATTARPEQRTTLWFYRFGAPAQIKVTNFTEATIFNGAISRDGRSMLVTRGAQAWDAFLITNFR